MKIQVTLMVQQYPINRVIKDPLGFLLKEGAMAVDLLRLAGQEILKRAGGSLPSVDTRV